MPRMMRALKTVKLEAIRLMHRLASGTESRSSSREHCRSWRLAWRCSAAVGSVAAATVPGAARIDRHIHRTTADHHHHSHSSCSPPVVARTHRATWVQLHHHTHPDILSSGRLTTTITARLCRLSRSPNPLTSRTGHTPSRSHMTTTTLAEGGSLLTQVAHEDDRTVRGIKYFIVSCIIL